MRNTFNFFKKALDNTVNVLDRDSPVGYVQFNSFKTDVLGAFRQKKYLFKKKSFWSGNYDIYRADNQQLLGKVTFSNWKRKADITLVNGEKFLLKNKNFWGTQWSIDDTNREVIDFEQTKQFWADEGSITARVDDNEKMGLLVLLGIFVTYVFRRRAAAAS